MIKRFYFLVLMMSGLCLNVYAQEQFSPRVFVKKCKKYIGSPYKYGGNDRSGIDCSGIIHNAFTELDIKFPRVSYRQAEVFKEVKLKKIRKGDLVYFHTSGQKINHTGVVIKKRGQRKLIFLHATNSGVRKDNLASGYWKDRFVKATRPIEFLK